MIKLKKGNLAGWEFELADTAAPASTGARLAEELAEEASEEPPEAELPLPQPEQHQPLAPEAQPQAAEVQEQAPSTGMQWSPSLLSSHEVRVARAYLAEGLVFQELQREFGGFVQREVRIGSTEIDGIIATSRGAIAVEVKLVKDLRNWQNRIIDRVHYLLSVREVAKERYGSVSILVAVVVDNKRTSSEMSRRLRELRRLYPELDVRIFFLPELLEKYGLSTQAV